MLNVIVCLFVWGVFGYSAHGGVVKPEELGGDFITLRQIQFVPVDTIQNNEIELTQEQPKRLVLGTGIPCSDPGAFVSAPDGCNRCLCGENGELRHVCTRAYCPPGFPSEPAFRSRRFKG